MSKEMRRHIDDFKSFNLNETERKFSDNVVEIGTLVNDKTINWYKKKYPNKWILFNKELGYIWIKDFPKLFYGSLPEKIYHVSNIPNLDKIGIKPSTENSTPFGYYNFSFFYLDRDDVEYSSIPYIEGENHLYAILSDIPNVEWYEGFNYPIDGEENITTNSFISPMYIEKIS